MAKAKKAVKKAVEQEYKSTARVLGKVYTATGESAKEAIANLKAKNAKGSCILTVEKGEVKKDRILQPSTTFRLFNSVGLMREVALKNASLLFEGI